MYMHNMNTKKAPKLISINIFKIVFLLFVIITVVLSDLILKKHTFNTCFQESHRVFFSLQIFVWKYFFLQTNHVPYLCRYWNKISFTLFRGLNLAPSLPKPHHYIWKHLRHGFAKVNCTGPKKCISRLRIWQSFINPKRQVQISTCKN